jgi:hypothetical protein
MDDLYRHLYAKKTQVNLLLWKMKIHNEYETYVRSEFIVTDIGV